MKHLLIILSFLLLSSLLTSCEKKEEILYLWNTSSGFKWEKIGDKNSNPRYKGEVKREYIIFGNYKPEGLGSLTETNGKRFVGEWKNGWIWKGGEYTKNGKILYKWVKGKRIKQ